MTILFITEFPQEIEEYLGQGEFEKALASIDTSLTNLAGKERNYQESPEFLV